MTADRPADEFPAVEPPADIPADTPADEFPAAGPPVAVGRPRSALRRQVGRVYWRSRTQVRRLRRLLRRVMRRLHRDRPQHAWHPPPVDPLPEGPIARPGVRAAVVVSPRLALDLGYEWVQSPLQPGSGADRAAELQACQLVLLEASATASWRDETLRDLLGECREQGVPVVLWATSQEEDLARWTPLVDHLALVLDVDAGRLPVWQAAGAPRVLHAPAAVQPRVHNPALGRYSVDPVRDAGSCLVDEGAGTEDLQELVRLLRPYGLHVWQLRGSPAAADGPLRRARRGSLPVSSIGALGRRYGVAVAPVPPVGPAPWTALELAASGAAVVAAGDGLDPYLGRATLSHNDPLDTRRTVVALVRHSEWRDRVALEQSRAVLGRHTVGARVDTVVEALGLKVPRRPEPSVSAVVPTNRVGELDRVLDNLARQVHRPLELVLVLHGLDVDAADLQAKARERGLDQVVVVHADPSLTLGACMNLGVDAASGRYVAKMDDDNYYGAHFLSDLVRAFSYTDAVVVGKLAHFVHLEASGATLLRFPEAEHTYARLVQGGAMLMDGDHVRSLRFSDIPRAVDTDFLRRTEAAGGLVYSADRFNFVSYRRGGTHGHTWRLTDTEMLVQGPGRVLFYGAPDEHATV